MEIAKVIFQFLELNAMMKMNSIMIDEKKNLAGGSKCNT